MRIDDILPNLPPKAVQEIMNIIVKNSTTLNESLKSNQKVRIPNSKIPLPNKNFNTTRYDIPATIYSVPLPQNCIMEGRGKEVIEISMEEYLKIQDKMEDLFGEDYLKNFTFIIKI